MTVITINLGDLELDFLRILKETRVFPSRSEAVRHILRLGITVLREQIAFEQKVITKELAPFINGEPSDETNAFRVIPLVKDDVDRFNRTQDMFYLVPNNEKPCKYKILKRI